jgi:endonuclease III
MKREDLKKLLEDCGQRYSTVLGIDVSGAKDEEIFKWFLASILFGASITESSVIKTYKCFQKHGVLTPQKILETGWDGLVKILDEGSYTRYDFKTADKLLLVMQNLTEKYHGSLSAVHGRASDEPDLESRLKSLGKGIGDVTVSIFLRELRGVWQKADPKPTALVILAAEELGLVKEQAMAEETLKQLKTFWKRNAVAGMSFINFETALFRVGRDLRGKARSEGG